MIAVLHPERKSRKKLKPTLPGIREGRAGVAVGFHFVFKNEMLEDKQRKMEGWKSDNAGTTLPPRNGLSRSVGGSTL